jgi:hypothetical protein
MLAPTLGLRPIETDIGGIDMAGMEFEDKDKGGRETEAIDTGDTPTETEAETPREAETVGEKTETTGTAIDADSCGIPTDRDS